MTKKKPTPKRAPAREKIKPGPVAQVAKVVGNADLSRKVEELKALYAFNPKNHPARYFVIDRATNKLATPPLYPKRGAKEIRDLMRALNGVTDEGSVSAPRFFVRGLIGADGT